jgi:hypothetical protein
VDSRQSYRRVPGDSRPLQAAILKKIETESHATPLGSLPLLVLPSLVPDFVDKGDIVDMGVVDIVVLVVVDIVVVVLVVVDIVVVVKIVDVDIVVVVVIIVVKRLRSRLRRHQRLCRHRRSGRRISRLQHKIYTGGHRRLDRRDIVL